MLAASVVMIGSVPACVGQALAAALGAGCEQHATLNEYSAVLEHAPLGASLILALADEISVAEVLRATQVAARVQHALAFIYGRTAASLHEQASRARTWRMTPSSVEEVPFLATEQYVRGAKLVWVPPSARRQSTELHKLLSAPHELLFVCGHGAGIHIEAGAANLCYRPAQPANVVVGDDAVVPRCYVTGNCLLDTGESPPFPMAKLGARRLVLLACFGVTPGRWSLYDPAFGTGAALADNQALESTLTSVRAMTLTAADVALVYHKLMAGHSFAEVAALVNRHRLARGLAADLVCFGNPWSKLAPCQHELAAEETASEIVLRRHPPLTARSDLFVRRPVCAELAQPVVIAKSGEVQGGVVDLSGDLYLTVAAATGDVHIQLRSIHDIADGRTLDLLARHLLELGWFMQHWPASDVTEAATRAIDVARELVERWPLDGSQAYRVLEAGHVERMQAALCATLEEVAESSLTAFAAVARNTVSPDSVFRQLYRFVSEAGQHEPCAHCGAAVDVVTTMRRATGHVRITGTCQSCQWVYDGTHVLGRWLPGHARVRHGESFVVRVEVDNPYPTAMTGYAVPIFPSSRGGHSQVGPIVHVSLPAHGSGSVELSWTAPRGREFRLMTLIAGIVVGGCFTTLRRPLHLSTSLALVANHAS